MSVNLSSFDDRPGFRIDEAAQVAYRADLEFVLGPLSDMPCVLELGSGTGLFSSFLSRCGLSVTGVDRDHDRVAIAQQRVPAAQFVTSDLETPGFGGSLSQRTGGFDLVISRYTIHELRDPIAAFTAWGLLMRDTCRLALIENCWVRQDWGWSDWAKRSNDLPLACTQTWATAAYCLRKAGLEVTHAGWMTAVNALEDTRLVAGHRLYIVVARRPAKPAAAPDQARMSAFRDP